MARLINIGFGNVINAEKIVAVVNPDAAPVKRLMQSAKEAGTSIDATQGRRTKSVLRGAFRAAGGDHQPACQCRLVRRRKRG